MGTEGVWSGSFENAMAENVCTCDSIQAETTLREAVRGIMKVSLLKCHGSILL